MDDLSDSLASEVVQELADLGLTLGFAESLTGGMISSGIVSVPGASKVFKGSVVSYTNDVKINLLGVNPEVISEFTEVSDKCAEQMALGASRLLGCNIALSVTGIAGPGGALPGKPVGTVYAGVSFRDLSYSFRLQLTGDREKIRIATCEAVYREILHLVG
ncbi:MAG: CinA family protein [Saccharofermentans sp.]|jgi:PncC family amidohydrolase|nr:CinA family protein [Mageeibacillus sp.]MCI1263462.1 CinA family protein [Saccharofermentans sp.]MCI1274900.1 CinA family protein [Saccharofermentans sp.]MCI1769133.1 CinA family protein [Mageeibacillus sp.]MCI2043997.1 CinA family protein [Mageeibacillus sp.]